MTKQEIIEKRTGYLPSEYARKLQKQLICIYKKEYKPKHSADVYLKLILDWGVYDIKERHPQDTNYADTVYECFSAVSQRVRGYTKEQCLDQIYEAVKCKKQRIKEYKSMPTLEELVESDVEIDVDKVYYTKEKGTSEDTCDGRSGDVILYIRKIGIDEYFQEELDKFFNQK